MPDIHEMIDFLRRSENRLDLLSALSREQPLDRDALEARLDSSRRTVVRTINKLEERNHIHATSEGYRLTGFGEVTIQTYEAYEKRARLAERFRPFLTNVDSDLLEFDLCALQDAELLVADEASPFALLDRALELRRCSTHVRELAPAIQKRSIEQLVERVERDEDLTFQVILTAKTVEAAQSHPDYDLSYPVLAEAENVDHYVYSGQFPFFVAVLDDTVLLGATADDEPYAMIESQHPTVREWAEETLDEFRGDAVPMEQFQPGTA